MAVRQSFRRLNGVYLPFALVTPIYNSDDYRLYISFEVSISSIYFFFVLLFSVGTHFRD